LPVTMIIVSPNTFPSTGTKSIREALRLERISDGLRSNASAEVPVIASRLAARAPCLNVADRKAAFGRHRTRSARLGRVGRSSSALPTGLIRTSHSAYGHLPLRIARLNISDGGFSARPLPSGQCFDADLITVITHATVGFG
jgi:hypothetical protein